MAKEKIKKLLENSKKTIEKEHDDFLDSISKDLESFKKKTIDKI